MEPRLPHLRLDERWKTLWEERGQAVKSVLGDTCTPGTVMPFSWKEYLLPGACALQFQPSAARDTYLWMTLGLSQPLEPGESAAPWELALHTREAVHWAPQILYDLLTQWLCAGGVQRGGFLPLMFFADMKGQLCAGLADHIEGVEPRGSIRGMYLWEDPYRFRFRVSSGDFRLLTVTPVTEDEDVLAQRTSPAHLIMFLRRMMIPPICDPDRSSALSLPGANAEWERICHLSHGEAVALLESEEGRT